MVRKVIGLAGKSGSGKDVIADYISERYGYKKIAVADAIRDESVKFIQNALEYAAFSPLPIATPKLPQSFDVVVKAFSEAVYAKPTTPEMRVMLQWWGTEFRRSQDSDYWVKRLEERIWASEYVVVSDVRLPIEIDTIHRTNGEVWFVERPGVSSVGIPNHLTEIGLEGATFDRTILNDETLERLKEKVDYIFQQC